MLCKYQKSIKLLKTLKSYKWLSFTVLKYPFINETVSRGELQQRVCKTLAPWSRGGGYSWKFLAGVCRADLQILTLFQTKKNIFHTHFQTRPLKSILLFKPGFRQK